MTSLVQNTRNETVRRRRRPWSLLAVLPSALVSIFILAVVCQLFGAATAYAYGVNECAGSRFGSDLVCTAQDVSITGIAIVPGGPTSCVGGESVTMDLDVTVNFATPDRWDIGIFLSNDGKDPQKLPANGGAASCTVSVLPTTIPFLNLDPGPWSGFTDTCGDGNGSISGGTGSGVVRISGVPVSCQAVSLSGGKLFIPFLTSWDNQSSPSGDTCTSNLNPVPNTKSKCNVPNGAVEADVLKSTVNLVVLPTIAKTDGIAAITAGDSSTYSVVITNTTGATLNNAIFRDPIVANLTANSLGCSAAGGATCPASPTIAAMQGGGIPIPGMPANSSVTFTIGATVSAAAPAGPLANTAFVTVGGETNSASDTNEVRTKFSVSKSFTPQSIAAGGESVLAITLRNTNIAAASGVAFTDSYPANLLNAAAPSVTNTCGGTATAAAGGTSLSLSGGTIPAGGSCTITANVTSAAGGAYYNSTGTVTSSEGYVGNPASASLAVGVSSLSTSTKSWQDMNGGEPDPGDVVRYTLTLTETAGVIATGVSVLDTISDALTGLTAVSCPAGATCTVAGQTLTATDITVPANGSVTVVFDAFIALGTPAGTTINNCATVDNPTGIGASPCASTITLSPSAVAGSGNKPLYLHDGASTPAYKLSRAKPPGAQASVTVGKGGSRLWALSPALASPVTISPNVTPLAIIPVNLYLASNTANESRTVQADVTCSGGGTTYSETKIFDGTAVNNPYLPTTPTLVSFANLTISADHTCAAGQTWNLTVRNITTGNGTRDVIVYPVSGGNNSYVSLPSLNVINVDSVNTYDAAYPAATAPANGYFSRGQTVYVQSVVSDPFGSFDITSATITVKKPNGAPEISNAPMTMVADSGAATRTYEYAYTIPMSGPPGFWTVIVTAQEGTEGTVSDDGNGSFMLGLPVLTVVKSSNKTNVMPSEIITYTVQVVNTGNGHATNVVLDDTLSPHVAWSLDTFAPGLPFQFVEGVTPSGLALGTAIYSNNNGVTYTYSLISGGGGTPASFDGSVTHWRLPMSGNMAPGGSFTLNYRVMVK